MTKKLKPIPHFDSEDDEREFWATHESSDYFDWSKAKRWSPEVYKSIIESGTYTSSKSNSNDVSNFTIHDAPRNKTKKSK